MPTLEKLASSVDGTVVGDGSRVIERVATLQNAGEGDISFLANRKYSKYLKATNADAVIVVKEDVAVVPNNAILVTDPYLSYAKIAQILYPQAPVTAKIEKSAQVHNKAQVSSEAYIGMNAVINAGANIAAGCYIGPGCVIDENVSIGAGSYLACNISILKNCEIGERAYIHPGVVIGADGFGLANDQGKWLKIPQIGRVRIGNDVEIGANTTIDCGAIEDTTIADGVKLDNLIQIGHNVAIGAHTVIAACSAVAGSTKIGQFCVIGGKVGIVGHLVIVDNVQIMGMSMVAQSITTAGSYTSSMPVQPIKTWRRNYIRFKQLEDLAGRVKALEKKTDTSD